MKIQKLEGLLAAPFTAFTEAGEVNLEVIPAMAEQLLANGVKGAFVCGTTGEGISCTFQERIAIMEAWKKAAGDKLFLIAHTGSSALPESRALARCAQKMGYHAFSIIPTTFFRPANEEALVEYCRAAAEGAPELPFYYYHTMNARLPLSMRRFLELADGRIPNLAGIKFNCHDLYDYQNCLNACGGKYDIVFGVDEFFASALAAGAKAFIGSTYNYSAPLYQAVKKNFDAGNWDEVRRLMALICRGVDLLVANGGIPAGKAMMLAYGIDCGPARLPLKQLDQSVRQKISDAMAELVRQGLTNLKP